MGLMTVIILLPSVIVYFAVHNVVTHENWFISIDLNHVSSVCCYTMHIHGNSLRTFLYSDVSGLGFHH